MAARKDGRFVPTEVLVRVLVRSHSNPIVVIDDGFHRSLILVNVCFQSLLNTMLPTFMSGIVLDCRFFLDYHKLTEFSSHATTLLRFMPSLRVPIVPLLRRGADRLIGCFTLEDLGSVFLRRFRAQPNLKAISSCHAVQLR